MTSRFADLPDLPVRAVLSNMQEMLAAHGMVVLTAPPGAGKTTLVPLALLNLPGLTGRILMLEPRRLAARAAAERMASLRSETVGETVGFRIKGETKTSTQTRIEVVTEGILTRILQSDPELAGIDAIIFDEFHERSLNADLGLALAVEVREALRPDLRLIVMSATLDAEPVAALLGDAPIIRSDGRAYPVETRWLAIPRKARLDDAMADLIRTAHDAKNGDILAFLPSVRDIRHVAARLGTLPDTTRVHSLFGAMAFKDQRAALAGSAPGQRKIVLATAIAETSLTVEGVRIVVDAGLARRSRFDPGSGMAGLVTERATKAEATQRQGRAGRLSPGVCYRLWTRAEEGAMAQFAPPEIEIADLSGFALDLAAWGATPGGLSMLTSPPEAAYASARALLQALGALDDAGQITTHGREMAEMPMHPRLAHMITTAPVAARGEAVTLAALLEADDPIRRDGADITSRIRALADPDREGPAAGALRRIRADASQHGRRAGVKPVWRTDHVGALIALAYPDRIAQRRKGSAARFLLSGAKGARLRADDGLSDMPFLAIADLDLTAGASRSADALIRLAAPLARSDIDALFGDRMEWRTRCLWSRQHGRVMTDRQLMLGALVVEEAPWTDAPPDLKMAAMVAGIRDLGLEALPWTKTAERLIARVEWARRAGATAPPADHRHLLNTLEDWLMPHLTGIERREDLARLDISTILSGHIGWPVMQDIARAAPEVFIAPTGTSCRINYAGTAPAIEIRLQELFGLTTHPVVAGHPLVISLLSPAGRPVQTTADLPGFWRTSYDDVRKDMRGRYPRHPWPEDPASAAPTRRAKPRAK
ncbi:MAG: ATP-dependent helicase HrpB [Pseudomonadota bacterium]